MTASSRRIQPSPQSLPRMQSDDEQERHRKIRRNRKYPVLDKYILMNAIGKGTFGTVRFALDVQTVKPYAIKVIKKDKARRRILSCQVRREVAIMRSLRHPNVVKLMSVFSTDSRIFIVMDLITGGELFREVERVGCMSEPYARFFFQQLVRGLDYCHSRGVFHRDLKPENLLLDNDKTLKITDFGLSTLLAMPGNVLNEEKLLHTQCGTPHYVAPEILTMPTEGYLGAKTDVWSCGVILYVLVGGGLPFDDHTADSPENENLDIIFRKIIRCDIAYPPHFSDELVDLLEHIFKENPRDRYSLKDIARHSWFLGPITTSEGREELFAGRRRNNDVWQKNVQEILSVYDQYKPTGFERNKFCNLDAFENAIEITQGEDGIPLVRAPSAPGPGRSNASTDSLSLGLVKDSRETGLRYWNSPSWASDDTDASIVPVNRSSRRERDMAAQSKKVSFRGGKPIPEELTRVLSEAMHEKFGSHGSHSSDEDHGSDLENALEIGGYTDDDTDGQAYQNAVPVEWSENRKTIRRVRSADDMRTKAGWMSGATYRKDRKTYSINDARMAERFRNDLWNAAGAKFREEAEAQRKTFELRESGGDAEPRRRLVRSASFDGPFRPQTFKNSRAPRRGKMLPWAAPSGAVFRSGGPLAGRRPGRRSAAYTPSPLASTPVLFAQKPEERKSTVSGTGHEWKPYEHHDNLLWCKMMRDYDMIPDYEEFGMESGELNNVWKEGLARENLLPVQSVPRHGSTTFVLSRSSVEMSSRAWREKSRKWMALNDTPTTSFDVQPRELLNPQMVTGGGEVLEEDNGDFLTRQDIPAYALREFVRRTDLASCYNVEFVDASNVKFSEQQLRIYLSTLLLRAGFHRRQDLSALDHVEGARNEEHNNLDEDAIVPLMISGSGNMRTVDLLSTPPGVSPGLIQTSSAQTLLSTFRYPDMPSRHSRDGEQLPYVPPRMSSNSSVDLPVHKSPKRIASGPLRKGYGSETGKSSSSNKSSAAGKEKAELKPQNLFHLDIPGPEIRPPLPESRPFSRVLKPTTRVAKKLLSPRMPSLPVKRPSHFHSLVDVQRCQEIIVEILEDYGCDVRQEKKKGNKLRLRVSLSNAEVVLTAVVEVFAVDSTLTAVTFERKSGDQSAFLEFFSRIRQLHSEFVVKENAERSESGLGERDKNASRSTSSSRT